MRSILFFDGEPPMVTEQTVHDLCLRRTVSLLHRDKEAETLVLRLLRTPCADPAVIAARQAVLRDFVGQTGALETLLDFCKCVTKEARERKAARYRMSADPHGTDLSGRLLAVQDDGEWIGMLLRQYARMERFLDSLSLSAPLAALREELAEIVNDEAYARLCDDMAAFSTMRTLDTSFVLKAELTADWRHITFRLVRIAQQMVLYKEIPERTVRLTRTEQLYAEQTIATALQSLHEYLLQTARVLVAPFEQLAEELAFYDFGMRYVQMLTDKGAPIVWPTVVTTGETSYTALRDVYLTLHDPKLPLPNDIRMAPLMLITGDNGSGKTVLLRTIATAQLFAQAGLPLPATVAIVRVRRRVMSLYAADEKDVGRFEEECRQLSAIVDTVIAEDLLILNEPFQSTAYDEGERLLEEVLCALTAVPVGVVLVTHLLPLRERLLAAPPCAMKAYTAVRPYVFGE